MRACHRLLSRGLNCSHEVRVDAWLPKDAVTRSHLQSRGPSRCAPAGSRGRSQDRRRPPFEELEACATARVAPAAMVAAVRPAPSGERCAASAFRVVEVPGALRVPHPIILDSNGPGQVPRPDCERCHSFI